MEKYKNIHTKTSILKLPDVLYSISELHLKLNISS